MNITRILGATFYLILLVLLNSCVVAQNAQASRKFASGTGQSLDVPLVRLVPQESFGDQVLNLLDRRMHEKIVILQFNFFTDNQAESYPRKIAQKLIDIKAQNPKAEITVALESKKDLNNPGEKGAAQRNAKTKKLLVAGGIEPNDVFGQGLGISHAKMVMAGDEIIAGSSNLTKQSTDIGANNEMNVAVRSPKIAATLREYVGKVISNPGQMVDIAVEEDTVRLLTDRLHFGELIMQIQLAQKGDQLGLSMYEFLFRNDDDVQAKQVFQELIAAHKRGVQLEIFLNRAADIGLQNTKSNLRVAELLAQAGISKIYLDPTSKISHSKFLYRISGNEKVSVVSSVNLYRADFNDNHQLTWVIKDNAITDQLVTYFKQQIAYDGVLVSRIPKDSLTGLRYQIVGQSPEKTAWNRPMPAKRMLRFWRGFKQEAVSKTQFEVNVNKRLIPETATIGAGRGLNAYLPSFFSEGMPEFLPDEVAIIDYADEEKYNAIRTTERGRMYGPLHFQPGLFTKQNSKGFNSASLVVAEYLGRVEIQPEGKAYMLASPDLNWQQGISVRRTILPLQSMTPIFAQEYLSRFKDSFARLGINGAIAVIDPHYIVLMINTKNSLAGAALETAMDLLEVGEFKKIDQIIFQNQEQGKTQLFRNAGINVRFDTEQKSHSELFEPILNEISVLH